MSQSTSKNPLPSAASREVAPVAPAESLPPKHKYRMKVAYDGSEFHGWQKQHPPDQPPLRTVCGVVEDALIHALRQPIDLVGASRTDAGVHAKGQVAQFEAASRIPLERMADAVNSRLPGDVEVRDIEIAPPGFDAISGARCKQYRYRLWNTAKRPLECRRFVHHCWLDLDMSRMNDAAWRLVGTHDFEGFAQASHGRTTTVRTIFDCHVESHEPELQIVVKGDGFLYNMVRIIAGTLVEVGRGRFEPSRVDEVIRSRERRLAGPTLPPTGLWLEWIRYDV